MATFIYQSLNSNASTSHGIGASNSQHFTRLTQKSMAATQGGWFLNMPTAPESAPSVPVHGPAQLIPSAPAGFMDKGKHSDDSFLKLVEGKARQTHQQVVREFEAIDLMVFGELNGSHAEWSSMKSHAGPVLSAESTGKACNSFTVHQGNVGQPEKLGEGMGWVAYKSQNIATVFVHVPNADAKNEDAAATFYWKIQDSLRKAGKGEIDLILGDTNQPSSGFTQRVVSAALNKSFQEAHTGSAIQPADSYARSFGGTNSTGTQKYDVAVFNSATIKVNKMIYLSQCAPVGDQAAAVTDHMGIGIDVSK